MKSIKEMAEEYARTYLFSPQGAKGPDEHYIDGANYVLEQIEQLIYEKHVKGNLPLFDLTHLIDKLKKE